MAKTLSFFQIERSFIHFSKKHLTFSDTRVYMAFCRFSFDRYGKNFIVSVGYDALAKEAAVDPRSTKRSCKKMQKLGLLEKVGHSKAGCVMWKLVWQSPDGAEAIRAATMEAALKEGGGGSPTPAKPAVAEHPPSKSHLSHPQSRTSATLPRTLEEEEEEHLTSTSQGGKPDPDPKPDVRVHDLSKSQRTILQVREMYGGKSLADVICERAAHAVELREAGVDLERQREMSEYRAEQADEEAQVQRLSGKHTNGTTPAPSKVDDDEVPVELASNKQMAIREEVRSLVEDKKMPPPLRTAIRGDDDGDGSGS